MSRYHEVYRSWRENPQAFWAKAAADIDWHAPWRRTFETVDGLDRWFTGAQCNTCYNAVDRHVNNGRGGQKAIIHDSPVTGSKTSLTYAELLEEVATFAAVLEDLGARKGDRIIIYMPMMPQALDRDARRGAHRRHSFRGVRRFRRARAGDPHRRRQTATGAARFVRHRAPRRRCLQAAGRQGSGARQAQADGLSGPAAAAGRSGSGSGRSRLGGARAGGAPGRPAGRMRAGRGNRSALHSLHVRHHGAAQGGGARQRRPHGGPQVVDGEHLRRQAGGGVLGGVGRRLGGRPLLCRLRTAPPRLHEHRL